jgi:cell division protein FtsB
MGLLRHKELSNTKVRLEKQIKEVAEENEELSSQIKSMKEDPFYPEKHAREDFGLAKPDEYIFQYDR